MNMSGSPSFNFHLSSLYLSDWDYPSQMDRASLPTENWLGDRPTPQSDRPDQKEVDLLNQPASVETPHQDQVLAKQKHQLFLAEFSDPETAELAGELFIDAMSVQDALKIAQDYALQWGIAIFSLVAATEKQVRLHRLRMTS
ncbi:MAG: hypothetical protein WBA57_23335 [Elainellaceae cyanobacterium]